MYSESKTAGDVSGGVSGGGAQDGADDYSGTNNQVQGVDEADVIKTDGKYLFVVPRSGRELVTFVCA